MSKNPVVFWELASNDAEKSAEFFKKVFEWDIKKTENSVIHYVPAKEDSRADGGMFTLRRAKLPFLTIYIHVDDIHEMAKRVDENGGYVVEGPDTMPNGAVICLFNDPSGVTFGMLQKKKPS